MYNDAVKSENWELLLGVVNSFAHDKDVLGLLRPIAHRGASALLAAAGLAVDRFGWHDDHPVRRALAFLLVESKMGRQARTPRDSGYKLGTANGASVTVSGGTVAIYYAVRDPRGARDDDFALQYRGINADNRAGFSSSPLRPRRSMRGSMAQVTSWMVR
jgi:hypothetical protein